VKAGEHIVNNYFPKILLTKKAFKSNDLKALIFCGEGGIRTLGTSLSSYNGLANRPFRPLRHLSISGRTAKLRGKTEFLINSY
jgi:hypothetical protein